MKHQQQKNDTQRGEVPPKKAEVPKTSIRGLTSGFLLDTMTKMTPEALKDVRAASRDFNQVFLNHQDQFPAPAYMEEVEWFYLDQKDTPTREGIWTLSGKIQTKKGKDIIVPNPSAVWIKNHIKSAKNVSFHIHGPLPIFFGGRTDLSRMQKQVEEIEKALENDKEKLELEEEWERVKERSKRDDEGEFKKMKTYVANECKKIEGVFFTCFRVHFPMEDVISIFETSDSPRDLWFESDKATLESINLSAILPKVNKVVCPETQTGDMVKNILNYKNLIMVNLACSEFLDIQPFVEQWKSGSRNIKHWILYVPYNGPKQETTETRNDGERLIIDLTSTGSRWQFYIRERSW